MLDAGIIAFEGMVRMRSDTTRSCGYSCCAYSTVCTFHGRLLVCLLYAHCTCFVEQRLTTERQEGWTNDSERVSEQAGAMQNCDGGGREAKIH